MHCRRILKISQSRQDFFRGFVLAADENTFGHSDPSLFETARACAEHDPIWRLVRHKGQHSWTHCLGLEQIDRSEEHTSELQSLMRISYAVFCLKKQKKTKKNRPNTPSTLEIRH